jgi:hypothetical protein
MGGYANFGNKSQIRSSVTTNSSLPLNSNFDSLNAVVKQVITTDNPDPILDPITGEKYTQLGTILAESIFANTTGRKYIATPKSSYVINIPTINEIVTLYPLPTNNNPGRAWQYGSPISTFGISSVNNNISFPTDIVPPTQTSVKDYRMAEFGIPKNTIPQKQPKIFTERIISPLTQNSGDITYMGRYGQSLRFGNNSGDPITIIRNGQSPQGGDPWTPISENISKDPSSLYLTTTQKLPFALANENFNSYSTPPITPSTYTLPQAILISDRIVLNAKTDSVLISGHKSVGISSNDSINIESKQIIIDGTDIKIGSKDASQSVLKGDDTVQLLRILIQEIVNLSTALKVSQIYPAGIPSPDPIMNPVADMASVNLNKLLAQLDGIKSNFVKTI